MSFNMEYTTKTMKLYDGIKIWVYGIMAKFKYMQRDSIRPVICGRIVGNGHFMG